MGGEGEERVGRTKVDPFPIHNTREAHVGSGGINTAGVNRVRAPLHMRPF